MSRGDQDVPAPGLQLPPNSNQDGLFAEVDGRHAYAAAKFPRVTTSPAPWRRLHSSQTWCRGCLQTGQTAVSITTRQGVGGVARRAAARRAVLAGGGGPQVITLTEWSCHVRLSRLARLVGVRSSGGLSLAGEEGSLVAANLVRMSFGQLSPESLGRHYDILPDGALCTQLDADTAGRIPWRS